MGLLLGTFIYILLGLIGVFVAPIWSRTQTELIRVLWILATFCCWMSWALIYMAQMNPLQLPVRIIKGG
ncbi:unnamed protein product [Phytomonas sp. Hart1]|nr:unnamed protein product [Phytomonas sp. Hart1]|eukprot:CCW68740.1 unnamed protein product [Phytomonas sp. isolate Hart1]